jgi:Zn-dependent peptidase ImmA (M78 family)/DNA-binding XRE family transcriptional regulator
MRLGSPGFNGERLRQARQARGYQQIDFADTLGITRQVVSKYEAGLATPSDYILKKITTLLRLPPHFFKTQITNYFEDQTFLYRSLKSANKVDKQRAEARLEWLAEIVEYADNYVNLPKVNLPFEVLDKIPREAHQITNEFIDNLAKELRQFWGLGNAPIPNAIRLLEANGFVVALDAFEAPEIDGLSAWSKKLSIPFVMLNKDIESAVRLRFSSIHELGELLLHRYSLAELDKNLISLYDHQAHRLASSFLLPEEAFLADLYSVTLDSLLDLKQKWRVSIAAMLEYLKNRDVISVEAYRGLRVKLSKRGWKDKEPYDEDWDVEEPVLLKQALNLMVQEQLQSTHDIVYSTALDEQTLGQLTNLPEHFFQFEDYSDKLIFDKSVRR